MSVEPPNATSGAGSAKQRYLFKSTTTPQSERQLAYSLGYPKSWHVVRVAPNPNVYDVSKDRASQFPDGHGNTCLDTIYAGDPMANSDTYYNHIAALSASMKWKEGRSTPFDQKGGQMLDANKEYKRGDIVEALYNGEWFQAKIMKVKHFRENQIRYNIHYTIDKSSQTNVSSENIRTCNKPLQSKLKRETPTKKGGRKKSKKLKSSK